MAEVELGDKINQIGEITGCDKSFQSLSSTDVLKLKGGGNFYEA